MPTTRKLWTGAILLLAFGCSPGKEAPVKAGDVASDTTSTPAKDATSQAHAALASATVSESISVEANKPANPDLDESALADKVLTSWLSAQNTDTFAAYSTLYDRTFIGIRRTSKGLEKSFELDGWLADRKRLFGKPQQVAADNVVKQRTGDTISLSFVQRWKSGSLADHGDKVLVLARAGDEMKIIREELKWSESGWENSKEQLADLSASVSPITMTVAKERLPEDGSDCSQFQLRINLTDANGTKSELVYGSITGVRDDQNDKPGPLTPANGAYTDLGQHCAGLQSGYKIHISKDTLVAVEIWNDSESGTGKKSAILAKLPAGANVVMK